MQEGGEDRLDVLLEWFNSHGIKWQNVSVRRDAGKYSGESWLVMADKDLEEGDVLCKIPKKAVLSARNSELHEFLEAQRVGGRSQALFANYSVPCCNILKTNVLILVAERLVTRLNLANIK